MNFQKIEIGRILKAQQDSENWLEGVVEISRKIANLEPTTSVLEAIVTLARRLMQADVAAIALLEQETRRLSLICHVSPAGIDDYRCDTVNATIILRAVRQSTPLRFPEDRTLEEAEWHCPLLDRPIRAAAIVPLILDGTAIGALWAIRFTPESFTCAHLVGLARLADQAVIALEHGTMASKIQSIAVTEERYRIAREMHDSLAQVLGYLNLQMQTLEYLVKAGDCAAVLEEVRTSRSMIKAAQQDVRESILSLRTTLSEDLPLLTALEQYVLEFGAQTGIDARFEKASAQPIQLSPLAEMETIRIVQEALTNVRKHAQAAHVCVGITASQRCLSIAICDDGIGFDLNQTERSHFGLATMRERAQKINGTLTITSAPGVGTAIHVQIPLLAPLFEQA